MPTKKHDWNKEQPHHPNTGKFVKRKTAEKKPSKYTWVTEKKGKK